MKKSRKNFLRIILVILLITLAGVALVNTAELAEGRFKLRFRAPILNSERGKGSDQGKGGVLPRYDEEKCYDSDKGLTYSVRGTTYGKMDPSDGKTVHTDSCSENQLTEYYCSRHKVQETVYDCASEDVCEEGECKEKVWTEQFIESGQTQTFTIDYDTYLINSRGLKIYPVHLPSCTSNGFCSIPIVLAREFDSENYWLGSDMVPVTGLATVVKSIFSSERITVQSFDEDSVTLTISDNCPDSFYEHCNALQWDVDFTYYDMGKFKYYVGNDSVTAQTEANLLTRSELDEESWEFLEDHLGITSPLDEIVQVFYEHGLGYSAFTSENSSITYKPGQILPGQTYVNTHEMLHLYLIHSRVMRSWFEEGLAFYFQKLHRYGQAEFEEAVTCMEDGFISNIGDPEENPGFIPYSDFSQMTQDGNESSSAECFWRYIEGTYGEGTVQKVVQKWVETKTYTTLEEYFSDHRWPIKDLVNPVLSELTGENIDMSTFVWQRYNYFEPE
jgi:hypothetical protein